MRTTETYTREDARKEFEGRGLSYSKIKEGDILILIGLLNKEIEASNKNGETSTKTMHMSGKMKLKKNADGAMTECYMFMSSDYFDDRECISFNKDGFVGFAGWADNGNTAPLLRAFRKWMDYLCAESEEVAKCLRSA